MAIFRRNKAGVLEVDTFVAPNARSLTAAAMPLSGPGVRLANAARAYKSNQDWQRQGWYFFDAIGELRSPLVWIANAVSQAEIHATELDPDTGMPTGPSENSTARAAAAAVLGGPSKRGGKLRTLALHWQVPGESFVLVIPGSATLGTADRWLVLSPSKVMQKGRGNDAAWEYTDPLTGVQAPVPPKAVFFRVWQPHPDDEYQADSAVRSALPECREVEKATMTIAAQLDSRIANAGVWLAADELDVPRGEHATGAAAFLDQLLMVAETSIQQPGTPAAVVPMAFNAPGELIASGGALAHVAPTTEFVQGLDDLRDKALARLANSLDMPRDVAAGTQGESNHWSAWQVEESTYKIFVEPLLRELGDAITTEWFRPALVAMGMDAKEAERYEIGWDTTKIVARPDDQATLDSAWDRVLISDEYWLTESGYPVDALPDADERTRRMLEKIVVGAPTLLADPAIAAALGLEVTADPAAAGVSGAAPGAVEGGQTPADADQRALPEGGTQDETPATPEVPDGLVAAAELIVYDALSRVGGRLLTNQNRGQFKTTPRHELHVALGVGPFDTERFMEGSFQFVEPVAQAFGLETEWLRERLSEYVEVRLLKRKPHDREVLKAWLV